MSGRWVCEVTVINSEAIEGALYTPGEFENRVREGNHNLNGGL